MQLPFNLDFSGSKISRVTEGSDPFLLAQLYQESSTPLLVITNTVKQAEYLSQMLPELLPATEEVYFCPDWETLAYDQFSPTPSIVSQRIQFLSALASGKRAIYLIATTTALHKLSPKGFLISKQDFYLGKEMTLEQMKDLLEQSSYKQVEIVYEPGEFAVNGINLDFFPMDLKQPYRISFFENKIDKIRTFDPETQKTSGVVDKIVSPPGNEYPINKTGIQNFLANYYEYFDTVSIREDAIFNLVASGIVAQGAQYYLPLFFNVPLDTIADYLPENSVVVNYSGQEPIAQEFAQENELRYKSRANHKAWPAMPTKELFISLAQLLESCQEKGRLLTFMVAKNAADFYAQEVKQPLQSSAFLPLQDIQASHLQNSIAPKERLNRKASANNKASNTVNNGSESSDITLSNSAKHNPDQSYAGEELSLGVAQLQNLPKLERSIFLGITREHNIVTGDNTLNYLSSKGKAGAGEIIPLNNSSEQLGRLANLLRRVKANFSKVKIAFTVPSLGKLNALREFLEPLKLEPQAPKEEVSTAQQYSEFFSLTLDKTKGSPAIEISFIISQLKQGLAFYGEKQAYLLISQQDILGSIDTQARKVAQHRQKNNNILIQNLLDLKPNMLLVHQKYGICQYKGIKTEEYVKDQPQDLIVLRFSDVTIEMTVNDLHQLSVFSYQDASDIDPRELSSYSGRGARKWQERRAKSMREIAEHAADLLSLQSQREIAKGFKFEVFQQEYQEFCSHFKYEETPDQYATIQQVLSDMASDKKMERLICGDVGFGKTEIAMRAAFVAITNGKQVAILAPTTLLAKQHYESFKDRFAYSGAEVEMISSFSTASQKHKIYQRLERGLIDVLIGTHAILSDKVKFKDLGLLVIDEEHQFGVKQKNKILKLKNNIDVLTMTATPIPRTLNMALHGFKDISLITTAPPNRLPIITKQIHSEDDNLIREAIIREIQRGGQVFFLHNRTGTHYDLKKRLENLVPQARVTTVHGQMQKSEIDAAMLGFYNQRYNVLVCSTIIETGIDVPNANTIIINEAQKFGLAQLHQIRGRVGRSYRQAFAYLVVDKNNNLSDAASLRLQSMTEINSLGAGYILATNDLDIRGAGEILGDQQSGNMNTIGYSLYTVMLKNAIKQLRRHQSIDNPEELLNPPVEIKLGFNTTIPSSYIPANTNRIYYYRQLAAANSEIELDEIRESMIDRFGELPASVQMLFHCNKLRVLLLDSGVESIHSVDRQVEIKFKNFEFVNTNNLIALVQKRPLDFAIPDNNTLILRNLPADPIKNIQYIAKVLLKYVLNNEALQQARLQWSGASEDNSASNQVASYQASTNKPAAVFTSQRNFAQLSAQEQAKYLAEKQEAYSDELQADDDEELIQEEISKKTKSKAGRKSKKANASQTKADSEPDSQATTSLSPEQIRELLQLQYLTALQLSDNGKRGKHIKFNDLKDFVSDLNLELTPTVEKEIQKIYEAVYQQDQQRVYDDFDKTELEIQRLELQERLKQQVLDNQEQHKLDNKYLVDYIIAHHNLQLDAKSRSKERLTQPHNEDSSAIAYPHSSSETTGDLTDTDRPTSMSVKELKEQFAAIKGDNALISTTDQNDLSGSGLDLTPSQDFSAETKTSTDMGTELESSSSNTDSSSNSSTGTTTENSVITKDKVSDSKSKDSNLETEESRVKPKRKPGTGILGRQGSRRRTDKTE